MGLCRAVIRQGLWLSAVSVPIAAGACFVRTAGSVRLGLLSYVILGMLAPFLFFAFQRNGYGMQWGARRSAAHLVWGAVILAAVSAAAGSLMMAYPGGAVSFFSAQDAVGIRAAEAVLTAAVLAALTVLMVAIDYETMYVFDVLKQEKWKKWKDYICLLFFIALVPAAFLIFAVILMWRTFDAMGLGALSGYMLFMAAQMAARALYLKVILAMIAIPLYLYSASDGPKMKRAILSVSTGLFWLIITYAPIMISMVLPDSSSWRSWGDPAYLSMLPVISDILAIGISLFAARRIVRWVYDS